MDERRWAHQPSDLPPGEHYAILVFGSVHIPGDERSRTHPGHGYPAHSEPKVEYIVFTGREAWEQEVKRRAVDGYAGGDWVPVIVRRATVTMAVNVSVSTEMDHG